MNTTDPEVYVTAQRWEPSLITALEGHATGIVLGDLFCQKRMFENEWFDVPDLARLAGESGLRVVFQTPAYNTTRTMEGTLSVIRKLANSSLLDAVLAHDVGVVHSLREFEGTEIWWDRFSFNRDIVPNAHLVDFLVEHGVTRIEVTRPMHVTEVASRGCGVLVYGYGPEIASFGRICYTEYFLNEPCERKILCSRSKPSIASVDKVPLRYVADGYSLIDDDNPLHTMPQLDFGSASKVLGITASIRGEGDISAIDTVMQNLSRVRGGATHEGT